MGKALLVAQEINTRTSSVRSLSFQQKEDQIHHEMLAFHGINGISLSGRRALFKDLVLIAKADVYLDGQIRIWSDGFWRECEGIEDFEQQLGQIMARYIR